MKVGLFVAATRRVVGIDPAHFAAHVEPGEQRHHHQALHGHGQVGAHHLRKLVGFALQADRCPFDLFVVLELKLEQSHHLHGRPGGPGDGHPAVAVRRMHLFHVAMGDRRAGGGPPVPHHQHPILVADGGDGGAVAHLERRGAWGCPDGSKRIQTDATQQLGEVRPRFVLGAKHRNAHRVRHPTRARTTTAEGEPRAGDAWLGPLHLSSIHHLSVRRSGRIPRRSLRALRRSRPGDRPVRP